MDFLLLPKKLKLNKLPTKLDILRAFAYEKEKWLDKNKTKKNPGSSLIADILTEKLQMSYDSIGIKTLRKDKIKQQILKIYTSRMNILKIRRSMRYSKACEKKVDEYVASMAHDFDVSDRTCSEPKRRKITCKKKVNDSAALDASLTHRRSAAVSSRQKSYAVITNDESRSNSETDDIQDDPNYQPECENVTTKKKNLSEIIAVKSRYSLSDRGTSAIVNATLKAFDIPTIIDKSRLARTQKRTFEEVDKNTFAFGGGLYYDSRKDKSIIQKKKEDGSGKFKFYRTIRRQSHYSFVSEPGGIFLGFIPVKNGQAKPCVDQMIPFLREKNAFNGLMALGSDGENFNVGATGGINHFIEVELNRPLHWFICLLHANEIPLKTLITKLDGRTTGKKSFSGPIGKALENVDQNSIVKFKKFRGVDPLPQPPDDVYKKLSNDQKYLHRIVNALISGSFSQDLSQLKIGEINHSRWITTASRVCKLYASTIKPSSNLRIITNYIVKVHLPYHTNLIII